MPCGVNSMVSVEALVVAKPPLYCSRRGFPRARFWVLNPAGRVESVPLVSATPLSKPMPELLPPVNSPEATALPV